MKMKRFILSAALLLITFCSFSQTYGNEWINYTQSYYRFEIYADGIYKIDYDLLYNQGIPLSSFNPKNMQVFGKQKEIPIYVVDGGDQSFDPGDYFLFYAQRNDGWLDSLLYTDPNGIGNPSYSLYNDTINYFFTWNNQTNNKRFTYESDNPSSVATPAPYWLYKIEQSFNNFYVECKDDNSAASSSYFLPGEGWSNNQVNGINGYTYNIAALTYSPYTALGAPPVKFHGISVSNSNAWNSVVEFGPNHDFSWKVGTSDLLLYTEQFSGYQQKNVSTSFPANILNGGGTPLKWIINASTDYPTDFQSLSYWSMIYPKQTTLGGANKDHFWIKNNTSGPKIRLDITNSTLVNPIMMVFGGVPKLVSLSNSGTGIWQAVVTNATSGIDQEVVLQDESTITSITKLIPVSASAKFRDFSAYGNDTNVVLMVYHPSLESASGQYASYRSSVAGGSYNVVLANVEELYMQYGGGIEKHVLGLRRFAHDFYNHAQVQKPKALFLMGKGIREANESFNGIIPGTRKSLAAYNNSLIPSFGYPSSDALITAGLDTTIWEPLIPTGRIAVHNNTQLLEYLEKVKEFDAEQDQQGPYTAANKEWQKQVLHFAGGNEIGDQLEFQGYLESMKDTIEQANFGGNVTTYKKTSSDPLDPNLISEVGDKIEQGVSIMNFFGHAAVDGFEINIDDPNNWDNEGKYPLVIGNACYSGDIFQNYLSTSEKFVLLPDEGAIAFLSTVRLGYAFALNYFTSNLYREISKLSYGDHLSHQIKRTIRTVYDKYGDNIYTETACTQMTLHGDPLLRLNWHAKPEIDITEQSMYFNPADIDLTTDSIEVNIILTNLGRSVTEPFTLDVKRHFPTNIDSSYQFIIPNLNYKDTFSFMIPLQSNIGLGLNQFSVDADIPSVIPEFEDISNNRIENKVLMIDIDGIIPVVPYDFAVVPRDSVTVKGSTVNPIADFKTYRFEIDTTDLFNSPQRRIALVSGLGGVKEVHPSQWKNPSSNQPFPLVCTDSTVYFWRCSIDSSVLDWRESSFQYIEGKTGWGQDHFFQFKKNSFTGIEYDRPDRLRHFEPITKIVSANVIASSASPFVYNNQWKINGQQQDYGYLSTFPSLYVGVIDHITFEAWGTHFGSANPDHSFGNFNDNQFRVMKYFTFYQNNAASMASFENMVLNEVPDSSYILVYTPVAARYDLWSSLHPSMYSTFAALGSDSINPSRPNRPMAFFCKKGDLNSVVEVFGQNPGDDVYLEAVIQGTDNSGLEASTLIGPAASWGTVYWKQDALETPTADETRLRISAYDLSGTLQNTIDTVFTHNDSIISLNNIVDAQQYPYLKLEAFYNDTLNVTPAQVDRWHVLYQPLPEAAIDGSNPYTFFPTDTIVEGQMVTFAIDVRNIYDYDMDSLLIRYWTTDQHNVMHEIPYPRQDSLRVGQVLRDTITFSSQGLGGVSSLWMEVNPYISAGSSMTDQPEQQHFNNLLQIPFYVDEDDVNPILDVTFDGRHILNGDIIAPKSEVLITLKDDNPYLIMDNISDTTLFGIYLTDPAGIQTRIPFIDGSGNQVLQWIPAESNYKKFKIIYSSYFEKDGKYTLLVQGSDRSGNLSGDMEYRITFEVIHESSITYLMNYPNPFSTSTRFVFTLTGQYVPEDVIIQIMTVSGKVVREITEDELGPVFIGRNVTEYAWDGKDEFGDQLANGVYLYTVKARINGEDIKHRESGADTYFKKNFGKMYLLR